MKLEYDNLYKFLVSLGIIFIIIPIMIIFLIYNSDPVLISQVDYDMLSKESLKMINQHEKITNSIIKVLPYLVIVLTGCGIGLLAIGISKWWKIQIILDNKLKMGSFIQTLTYERMNNQEINRKREKEVKESIDNSLKNEEKQNVQQMIYRYSDIEMLCFKLYSAKYSTKYSFDRNIRVGKHEIDIIGVSKRDNIDLIFEVKYWNGSIDSILERINRMIRILNDTGREYRTIQQRDCRLFSIIVTSDEKIKAMKQAFKEFKQQNPEISTQIKIDVLSEKELREKTERL